MPSLSPTPWQGRLHLEFTHPSDKTILSRSEVQAPLKVQRPFYPEGAAVCHSVMLHTAGGIVGGDRLSCTTHLHPQAQVLVTTAAATKIYRSNGITAQQNTRISVAEAACLEWLPQETIVFDGAIYRQNLRVELAANATWIGWDITRLGRSARGEQFLSGEWRSRTEVWQGDRLLWVDPQYLIGGSEMLQSDPGLAGYPVIASFAFIKQPIPKELLEKVRGFSPIPPFPHLPVPASETGVTRLTSGLLCRYRGNSTSEARHWFIQVWQLLRHEYLGRSICIPRVWQM
ncbi:MAG: urease accessory protein UreD [Cyanobacteria bacterium RU_5_0]|nr:urease accessory protein UreD [Cyanobacteria bacterium RU_5_0]